MRDNTEERAHGPWNEEQSAGLHGAWHHGHAHDHGHGFGPGRGRERGGPRGPRGSWGGFFGGGGGSEHWGSFFGGPGFGGPGFGGPGFGGGRERLERGALRYLILSVLKDGPQHGYEIIKQMEEKTFGFYSPSPGTLYPTLQYLEDLGLVRSDQEADRRVYNITDNGRAELDKQSDMVNGFWARFQNRGTSGAAEYELRFAGDAFRDLVRTVVGGFRSGALRNDPETVRKVRAALEKCQNDIREIITRSAGEQVTPQSTPDKPEQSNTGQGTVQL
jgi:DNA-binding PadR family transcriptional regulator